MAHIVNHKLNQGATFVATFKLLDENNEAVDLSGFTAVSKMRKSSAPAAGAYTFDTTIANGAVSIFMTANTTSTIPAGQYVYDCKVSANNIVTRIVEGIITVSPEVSYNDL